MRVFRRHDRVWLERGFDPRGCVCDERLVSAVEDWIRAVRPLIVARQHDMAQDSVRLGLTLPARAQRRRVTLVAPRAAIERVEAAMLLTQAMDGAPVAWQPVMQRIADLCRACGVTPHVYGSLAMELETGAGYLNAASDVDILFQCEPHSRVEALLDGLSVLGATAPRADGEVRFASGWAVAWRELQAAKLSAEGGQAQVRVLAKSEREVRLIALSHLCVQESGLAA